MTVRDQWLEGDKEGLLEGGHGLFLILGAVYENSSLICMKQPQKLILSLPVLHEAFLDFPFQ